MRLGGHGSKCPMMIERQCNIIGIGASDVTQWTNYPQDSTSIRLNRTL